MPANASTCAQFQTPNRWADLPQLDAETAARAGRIRTMLTGDPAFQYSVAEVSTLAMQHCLLRRQLVRAR